MRQSNTGTVAAMTPGDLHQHLLASMPAVVGIAAVGPWEQRPFGLVVTMASGGCSYWMVTGASGVAPAPAKDAPPLEPLPVPDFPPGKVPLALVEQALLAVAMQGGQAVSRVDRYSTKDVPPAVCFGANIDYSDDNWRLFLSAVGTSPGPGDRLRPVSPSSEV